MTERQIYLQLNNSNDVDMIYSELEEMILKNINFNLVPRFTFTLIFVMISIQSG